MKTITITSEQNKIYAVNLIKDLPLDGDFEAIIKKTDKSSTTKQRGLKWRWNSDIANSGLGRHDTAKDVHVWNKMKFGHPIAMRDDEFYGALYSAFSLSFKHDENWPEMLKWFSDKHIRTEQFTRAQNAEYLTALERYWISLGCPLADPDSYGEKLLRLKPPGAE